MVTKEQLYILDYYKRNTYMGSYEKLNFRVHKVSVPKSDDEDAEKEDFLEAICWPGPFIYDKTPDEKKIKKQFEYSDDGLTQVVDWLNEQHDALD